MTSIETTKTNKISVKIMPREVILDTQGRAVEASLKSQGFKLSQCRVGKWIDLYLPENQSTNLREQVEKMIVEGGLYNPLIENFEIHMN